jgi:hypothetical protein
MSRTSRRPAFGRPAVVLFVVCALSTLARGAPVAPGQTIRFDDPDPISLPTRALLAEVALDVTPTFDESLFVPDPYELTIVSRVYREPSEAGLTFVYRITNLGGERVPFRAVERAVLWHFAGFATDVVAGRADDVTGLHTIDITRAVDGSSLAIDANTGEPDSELEAVVRTDAADYEDSGTLLYRASYEIGIPDPEGGDAGTELISTSASVMGLLQPAGAAPPPPPPVIIPLPPGLGASLVTLAAVAWIVHRRRA